MRTVLVTGAARRVGAAIARRLAGEGWQVLLHFSRSATEAESLARTIRQEGGRCELAQADLADRAQLVRLMPELLGRHGPIEALVNNASSFRYDRPETATPESWDEAMGPNLTAPVFLAQLMAKARGGHPGAIVNLLDAKLATLNPDFFSYTVAKAGLAAATTLLAMRYGPQLRVNGVAPGLALRSGKQTDESFRAAWVSPPLGRSTTPDEIADSVSFLLTESSVNGQVLTFDGGDHLLARRRDIAFEIR